jgi:hypothetical protein
MRVNEDPPAVTRTVFKCCESAAVVVLLIPSANYYRFRRRVHGRAM